MNKQKIEELVGEAYEIGHAHGMNPYRVIMGKKPQRVDDGWGPIAKKIYNELSRLEADNAEMKNCLAGYKEFINFLRRILLTDSQLQQMEKHLRVLEEVEK